MQFRHARVIANRYASSFTYISGLERVLQKAKQRDVPAEGILKVAALYDLKHSTKQDFQPQHHAAYPQPLVVDIKERQEILTCAVERANQRSFGLSLFYKTWNNLAYVSTALISGGFAVSATLSAALTYFVSTAPESAFSQYTNTSLVLTLASAGLSVFFSNVFAHMRNLRKATRMCLNTISFGSMYDVEQAADFMVQTTALQREALEKRIQYEGNCLEAYSEILDLIGKMDRDRRFFWRVYSLRLEPAQNAFLDNIDDRTFMDLKLTKAHLVGNRLSLPLALHSLELSAGVDRSLAIAITYDRSE